MSSDTLNKRYTYKLLSNLISFLLSFVTAGIIPRSLGVINYGNFNFVTTILSQIITLLDFRVSTCFFTKLSQRPNDKNLVSFYFYYLGLIIILLFGIIFLSVNSSLKLIIFPDQSNSIIFYSFIFIILTWYSDFFVRILDAKGLTVILEKHRVLNKIVSVILLLALYLTNHLNLVTYFLFLYVTILFLLLVLYKKSEIGSKLFSLEIFKLYHRKILCKEFYQYSSPLGIYVILQFIQTVFDRWLLQVYGGSFEQGLYSFSFNLTNFCFIFITALIPLFTRELSVSIGKNDLVTSAKLYRQYVPLLYAITAFFCAFIFVEIKPIILLFGGKDYMGATIPLQILAFYPLVSVYSNLNGSVIYANGNTKIFLKLGLIFTPISMITSLILINKNVIGFSLGASGLAIKNVVLEFLSVLIIFKVISKFLHFNYGKYIVHMIFSLLIFIGFAYIPHFAISMLFPDLTSIYAFLLSGFIYSGLILFLIIFMPIIIGLKKESISDFFNQILNQFKLIK